MACPICEKETDQTYRPFCSKHCADIDLGRWFNGTYTMPDEENDAGDAPMKPTDKKDAALH